MLGDLKVRHQVQPVLHRPPQLPTHLPCPILTCMRRKTRRPRSVNFLLQASIFDSKNRNSTKQPTNAKRFGMSSIMFSLTSVFSKQKLMPWSKKWIVCSKIGKSCFCVELRLKAKNNAITHSFFVWCAGSVSASESLDSSLSLISLSVLTLGLRPGAVGGFHSFFCFVRCWC